MGIRLGGADLQAVDLGEAEEKTCSEPQCVLAGIGLLDRLDARCQLPTHTHAHAHTHHTVSTSSALARHADVNSSPHVQNSVHRAGGRLLGMSKSSMTFLFIFMSRLACHSRASGVLPVRLSSVE